MRTMYSQFPGFRTIPIAAISCLALSLAACKSNGTVQTSMGDRDGTTPTVIVDPPPLPNPDPTTQTTPFTPLQEAVGEASDGLRAVPMLLNDLGGLADGLLDGITPLADPATPDAASTRLMRSAAPASAALSPVLSELGLGLDALVLSTENGLGQLGNASDPVGTTLAGTEGLLLHTGSALNNAGDTVQALGARLGPVSAVTDVAGNVVGGVSQLVTQVGGTTGNLVTSTPVTGLTSTVNNVATPVVGAVLSGVQNVGVSTGLAEPIDNLLSSVGGLVSGAGAQAQNSDMPVITPLGMLVNQAGMTVTALGGIAGADASSGSGAGLLNGGLLSGGLLGGGGLLGSETSTSPVTGLVGGLLGSNSGGLLSPLTGGLQSGGASGPLAPVSNLLTGLTGGLSNIAPPPLSSTGTASVTQPLSNLLTPLTSLLRPPQQ